MKVVVTVIAAILLFSLFMASQTPAAKPSTTAKESTPPPKLTPAQKLPIRDAQVSTLQAYQAVQATPQWQEYQKAQTALQQAVAQAYKESGVDQGKWQLSPDLEFVQVPQAQPLTPAKDKP